MIKLRDLQYLTAIAEHRHFGQAAEACFVSQPTLSGQIMKLEEQLNLQLIERHRRNVMLTPAGEQLVKEAHQVLQAAQNFEETAKALLDPLAGELLIGLIPTLSPYIFPYVVDSISEDLPNMHFYLHEKQTQYLLKDLNDGKLDVLILPLTDKMQQFERYELFTETLELAVPVNHELADKQQVEMSDLDGQNIMTLEDGHCLREHALQYCIAAGAKEDRSFTASSLETLRYMVAANRGITLLPKLSILGVSSGSRMRYIPFKDPQPSRQICLLIRPNYSRMEMVRALVAILRNSLKEVC